MSPLEWLVAHLPKWLNPFNPWGTKGRPPMPDMHETINRQQAASLRVDRMAQRAQREAEERRGYRDWQERSGG